MPLAPGTRLGSYEVLDALGAGGMGEVYRARDSKLGRAVAVKIVREDLAGADRVLRFEREAKVLASLNHPHIAALYGMEQADGRHFLVMELVEGETLADRLRRGAMPVEDTLKIAQQIAEALEAAHEKSIVHRDLKPANVKITPDEKVKVLDFGLAKAMETDRPGGSQSDSPTLSMMASQAGIILGTAAYMSPEQAKGFPADHRSDVFSFGVVLYEMLAGRQPFQGETAPDVLASVLVREADLSRLPPNLNPRLPDVIRRCLEKSPKRRWQAIGDLRTEIESIAAAPKSAPPSVAPPRPLWRRAFPAAAAALLTGALAAAAAWYLRPLPAPLVTRFSIVIPDGQVLTSVARNMIGVSPDGTLIAYVANNRLFLRSVSQLDSRPLSGTEGIQVVTNPVFSPDGRSIAFYGDRSIKRIALAGGAPVTICPAAVLYGMSWGPHGIVFGQGSDGVIRVSPDGGKPDRIVTVKADEFAQGPQILPGGTHVLFTLGSGLGTDRWNKAQILVESLATHERSVVLESGSEARYLATGHLVYAMSGTLFAVPFDLGRLKVTGGPVSVVEGVRRAPAGASGTANFQVSTNGALVYIPGPAATSGLFGVALSDRKGTLELLSVQTGPYEAPRASPDGRHIAFGSDDGRDAAIWTYDLTGATAMQRLTYGGNSRFPIWSRDGRRVTFQSDRNGDLGIFWQNADGTGPVEQLTKPEPGASDVPESWSPKTDTLLFTRTKLPEMALWTLTLPERKVAPFADVKTTIPPGAVFSPDGRWVAYSTVEIGRFTVYVQPFPPTGAKYQLVGAEADSLHHPMWSIDGKELFYNPRPGGFEVVGVSTSPVFAFGRPVAVPRPFQMGAPQVRRPFDLTPAGKFLGLVVPGQTDAGSANSQQIHVVLNWFEELKERVPIK